METKPSSLAWSAIAARSILSLAAVAPTQPAFAAGEPYDLQATSNPSPTQATLQWASDPAGVVGFAVERRLVGARPWTVIANLPGSQRQYADSGLLNQRGYEYRVRAFTAGGDPAGQISLSTATLVTPSAGTAQSDYDAAATPRNVDAQAVSTTEIIVTWTDATTDETGFKVERRQGAGAWTAIALPAANATLYKDTGLTAGATYEYRVSAERSGQVAVPSAGVNATVPSVSTLLRYVDGCVDNTGTNAGTLANPWRSVQSAANNNLSPGTTVLVRNRANCSQPTVYRSTPSATTGNHNFAALAIGNDAGQGQFATGGPRSGTASAWITYRNYPGERPKIRTSRNGVVPGTTTPDGSKAGNFHGISVRNASYIVIQGFEIEGHMSEVTLDEATTLNAFYKANPSAPITAVLDSSGITVGNGGQAAVLAREIPHHIIVRDNIVHDVPGGGINALYADWVTIENNRVTRAAAYSPYGASALNIYRAKDVDSNTTAYKMIVRGNVASQAQNLFPCKCVSYAKETDGNGIILDQFNSSTTQTTTGNTGANPPMPPGTYTMPAYAGRTLIANNIVTNNGGRGIHAFQSSNADIVFNTAVQNSQIAITGDGEITSQNARNIRAYNNIMVARADRPTHWIAFANAAAKTADVGTIDFNQNILFGGNSSASQVQVTSTQGGLAANNRVGLDPRFSSVSGNRAFSLLANSPAANSAWIGGGIPTPLSDVYSAPRPRGSWTDVGAVESF